MKKITVLAVAVMALSLASCKKDRTCTCTITPVSYTSNGTSIPVSGSTTTTVDKLTKVSKGGAACNSGETTHTQTDSSGSDVTVTKSDCKLS